MVRRRTRSSCSGRSPVRATQWAQAVTVANDSATHCVAIWVRKNSNTGGFPVLAVSLSGGTGFTRAIALNTQTGAAVLNSGGAGTHRVIDGGLWWIVEITVNNNTTGNTTLTVAVVPEYGTVINVLNAAATGALVVGQVDVILNATAYSPPIFTSSAAVRADPAYWPAAGDGFEPVCDINYAASQPQIFVDGVLKAVETDYTISSSGVVTFTVAPAAGAALTWTGNYYWRVRFDMDQAELNNFLYQLWEAKKVTLVSVKAA
jgi:hypothetical protein